MSTFDDKLETLSRRKTEQEANERAEQDRIRAVEAQLKVANEALEMETKAELEGVLERYARDNLEKLTGKLSGDVLPYGGDVHWEGSGQNIVGSLGWVGKHKTNSVSVGVSVHKSIPGVIYKPMPPAPSVRIKIIGRVGQSTVCEREQTFEIQDESGIRQHVEDHIINAVRQVLRN